MVEKENVNLNFTNLMFNYFEIILIKEGVKNEFLNRDFSQKISREYL